ncbi:MAG: FG-GAP-like repeat-containing protein [Prevotellaceae bacterium]|jgi:hypothetical protein|nr:FG-GAP-like repeat-containing protein [Prevotellaceae bacterium]
MKHLSEKTRRSALIAVLLLLLPATGMPLKAQGLGTGGAFDDWTLTKQATSIDIPVLVNDDLGDCTSPVLSILTPPTDGTATVDGASITFTPDAGYVGNATFTYQVDCDGRIASAEVTVNVLIDLPDNIGEQTCFIPAPAFIWDIAKEKQSDISSQDIRVHSYANILVGDVTGDGVPEIITLNYAWNTPRYSNAILIFNNDLTLQKAISGLPTAESYVTLSLALGDVDSDGVPEIIYGSGQNPDETLYRLYAYRADGTLVWTSNQPYIASTSDGRFHSSTISVADLDGDGNVEVFAGDRVFDGKTGNLLATLPAGGGRGMQLNPSMEGINGYLPAIGDVDEDGIQELVCGNTTYKVVINSRTDPAQNTVGIVGQINMVDGYSSLADIDGDGSVDVVVVGRPDEGDDSQMYVWSGKGTSGNQIGQTVLGTVYKLQPGDQGYNINYDTRYGQNGSRPFIGDINGDGKPEIAYTSFCQLSIFAYDTAANLFEQKYRVGTTDESAATTLSLFDFNLDGKSELVYRDETNLRIMQFTDDGTGFYTCVETTEPCLSDTHTEYPTVADIDNDGHAEIVVSGADANDMPYNNGSVNDNIRVMIFGSPSNSWAAARKVWNQHGYNAINVNEDLTLPRVPINPTTLFPGNDGITGTSDDVRPFNNFLKQQTILSKWGEPLWLAPDAQIVETDTTTIFSYNETAGEMTVNVRVTNAGDASFQSPFHVTVYKNEIGNTPSYTYTYEGVIGVGDTVTISFEIPGFTDPGDWFPHNSLVLKVNDNGNGENEQTVCDDSMTEYRYYGTMPTEQDVCQGAAGEMACIFTLSSGDTYQWQSSSDNLIWTDIQNATAKTFLPADQGRGITYYRVIVTGDASTNNEEVTSATVNIRVRSCSMPVNPHIRGRMR